MAVPSFVDRVTLHVAAGRGGHGVASVHREKFKPLGGPDGGNGGPGGSVILRVDPDVTTLLDYHHSSRRSAEHGGHGAGGHRNGGHGADLVLPVPDGTVVTDLRGEVLADLVGPGTELVIAEGGRGVAEPAAAALGDHQLGAGADHVGEQVALRIGDHRAVGDREDQVAAVAAVLVVPRPVAAGLGAALGAVVVGQQRGDVRVDPEDHRATGAAVAAVGAAERLELLTVDGRHAVPAAAGADVQRHPVDEGGDSHGCS